MPVSEPPSAISGHNQALDQIERIIHASGNGIGMMGRPIPPNNSAIMKIDLWLDGTGAFHGQPGGRDLGAREPFTLYIPEGFPFQPPAVEVGHDEFAGLPHIQWRRVLCLYAAANDWDPSEGMWGFFDRLITWYRRAARGELTDPVLPWHPPVTYRWRDGGVLIVKADLPNGNESNRDVWIGWVVISRMGADRFELRRWGPALPVTTSPGPNKAYQQIEQVDHGESEASFVAPFIALPESLGFEYPSTVGDLVDALEGQDINLDLCNEILSQTLAANNATAADTREFDDRTAPLMLLIGSPADYRTPGLGRIAHVAAWRVPTSGTPVREEARLDWMKVYDQREKSTIRRDVSRPVRWLSGRRILVLGCGALGAPISEHCVRAGVRALTIVDNGRVNPGILVRQPYSYADIGYPKAEVLSKRLTAIVPHVMVDCRIGNALETIVDSSLLPDIDMVIDATADRSVAAKLEHVWWISENPLPPILSVMAGHRSEHALVTVALQGATGAGADILRSFAIAASRDPQLRDVLDDFYPSPPRSDVFQPEPGCSDPTFIGSAADLSVLAGQLLNAGLTMMESGTRLPRGVHGPTRSVAVVRLPDGLHPDAAGARLQWGNDVVFADTTAYQVRIAPGVLVSMRQEALRAAAADSRVETGGVLLGQVDHSCRVVWVSEAYGLPQDSQTSSSELQLNVRHLRSSLAQRRHISRGLVTFIGVWHSHPAGPVMASSQDRETMNSLVSGAEESLSQALLIVVGGTNGRWQQWIDGFSRPDMHVELFFSPHQQATGM
jgi:proteasome lid subunit RPN8/RPN11